jgi:hypothetical protein
LNDQEAELIFEKVPQIQVQEMMVRSTLVNDKLQLPIEKQKAELIRRITALENGSAKQIMLENVRRARHAFQREDGDTGSPEVQGKKKKKTEKDNVPLGNRLVRQLSPLAFFVFKNSLVIP